MLSVLSRRVPAPRATRLACYCVPRSSPSGRALVDWALSDGATVSPALAVNATADNLRGVVATRDVAPGEVLIALPPTCTAFSAASAQAEPYCELGATLLEMQATGDTPGDEAVLAAWLCLAYDSQPGGCALRAYAHALPEETPDLPALWPPHVSEALLPWFVLDAVDDSRNSFGESREAAAAILRRLPRPSMPSTVRLQWAVAHVRARAVRYNVRKASGELAWSKCLMPIVDTQNHATSPLERAGAAPMLEQAGFPPQEVDAVTGSCGPATSVAFSGGGASWVAARPIPEGTHVTWTYGPLSNVQLLLQFGFVPTPALHQDSVVELTIPESVILGALDRSPVSDAAVDGCRRSLLTDAGALNMLQGEQMVFEVKPCFAPEALMAVCGAIALQTDVEWRLYSSTDDEGEQAPAGGEHAARAQALASSVLEVAAQRWCGDCPPMPEEPADDTTRRRAAAALALWQATKDTLRTGAVAALRAPVPRLQTD